MGRFSADKFLKNKKGVFFFLFCLGLALYGNTLKNPFILDDVTVISGNKVIKDPANFLSSFKYDIFGEKLSANTEFYRPLALMSFFADYALGKDSPPVYHFNNIVIHVLNCFLLYLLLLKMGLASEVAFFSVLVYLAHPVNTTAVGYISARDSLLGVFFGFSCFLSFLRGQGALSVLFFVFSALSKENMTALPLVMLFYRLVFERYSPGSARRSVLLPVFLVSLSFSYALLRLYIQKRATLIPLSFLYEEGYAVRILTFIKALFFYFKTLLAPSGLAFENHFIERNFFSVYNWGLVCLAGFMVFLHRRRGAYFKHLSFWLFWFLAGLAAVSNILLPLSATARLQWLYFPSAAMIVILVDALWRLRARFPEKRRFLTCFFGAWLVFLGAQTVKRNALWSDPVKFFSYEISVEPQNYIAWCSLGLEYFKNGDYLSAKKYFEESINRSPGKVYDVGRINLKAAEEKIKESPLLLKNQENQ